MEQYSASIFFYFIFKGLYSAFVEDLDTRSCFLRFHVDTQSCFLHFHEIKGLLRYMHQIVDQQLSGHLAQLMLRVC